MGFTKEDRRFMKLALNEAKKSFKEGNFPVGAVLVIDGKIVGKERNSMQSKGDWISHAENNLINKNSLEIRKKYLPTILDKSKKKVSVEIYTTLEPCLMCLGSSILNRISRIVFACSDPHGGATKLDIRTLPGWYKEKWPKIEGGLLRKESSNLIIKFIKKQKESFWKDLLKLYQK